LKKLQTKVKNSFSANMKLVEIGLFNPAEVDRIVEILEGDGYVLNSEVEKAEIRITDKGKERLENNQI
jgi:predicted transcriptional regulator